MSCLVVLFILLAENPQGTIHPVVSYAVMTVPTHGVIALVLAWHERVESTLIRVRRAGHARGGRRQEETGAELKEGKECRRGVGVCVGVGGGGKRQRLMSKDMSLYCCVSFRSWSSADTALIGGRKCYT